MDGVELGNGDKRNWRGSKARSYFLYYDKEFVSPPKASRSFKQGKACVLDSTSDREGESSVWGARPYAENACDIQGRRLQWPEIEEQWTCKGTDETWEILRT